MHFEVLVEDLSGKIALEQLLEKILGANYKHHSWKTRSYRGLGRIPKDLRGTTDPQKESCWIGCHAYCRAMEKASQIWQQLSW